MTVAGIDYSTKRLDVAVVSGRELVSCTSYDLGRDTLSQCAAIMRVVHALKSAGASLIVMEKPWMREGRGLGTALDLHRVPTRIETLAICSGLQVRFVPVNSWRLQVLGNGGLRTEEAKRAALRYVEMVYGQRAADHNAADAICLATWGQAVAKREAVAV